MTIIQIEGEDGDILEFDAADFFEDWEEPLPWYKRLWQWFFRKKEPEDSVGLLITNEEFNKRVAVAECIEAAISVPVWAHRQQEQFSPGEMRYRVVKVEPKHYGETDLKFWLYVTISPIDEGRTFTVPLHEFLEECYPAGQLVFDDYDA